MSLLHEVISASGGQERWEQVNRIKIHQLIGGGSRTASRPTPATPPTTTAAREPMATVR